MIKTTGSVALIDRLETRHEWCSLSRSWPTQPISQAAGGQAKTPQPSVSAATSKSVFILAQAKEASLQIRGSWFRRLWSLVVPPSKSPCFLSIDAAEQHPLYLGIYDTEQYLQHPGNL